MHCRHCATPLAGRYCIGSHRWPVAISKGLPVVVAGSFIDSFMSAFAIWLSVRLA